MLERASVSDVPIDNNWINKLIEYAENATSENMQLLWGKVLAGEVGVPGSFSLKSLEVLERMTKREADAFQKACNISSANEFTKERMLIKGFTCHSFYLILSILPTFRNEFEISDYLSITDLFTLQSIGLIHDEQLIHGYFSFGDKYSVLNNGVVVSFTSRRPGTGLLAYKFTDIGNELSKLIQNRKNDEYIEELVSSLSKAYKVELISKTS